MSGRLNVTSSSLSPEAIKRLKFAARNVASNAHAPFSHFHVGAAVMDDHDRLHVGCNVENMSFGLTMCAERNAVGAAVAAGAHRLVAVGVYAPRSQVTYPCGACRQVLYEFGGGMEVHLFDSENHHEVYRVKDLLPAGFALDSETSQS